MSEEEALSKDGLIIRRKGYCFGLPMTKARYINAAVIYDRFMAGETLNEIAEDYGFGMGDAQAAVIYTARGNEKNFAEQAMLDLMDQKSSCAESLRDVADDHEVICERCHGIGDAIHIIARLADLECPDCQRPGSEPLFSEEEE